MYEENYYIQGIAIKETEQVKINTIGVIIDKHALISFNEHINRIAHKANSVKIIFSAKKYQDGQELSN